MPTPTKRTEARMRKLRELHAGGASAREIATELGVDHKTALTWLEAAKLPTGSDRPKAKATRSAKAPEPPPLEAGEDDCPASDPDSPTAIIRRRLDAVRDVIARLTPQLELGEYQATQWAQLVKLEGELATRIVELTPTAPPDPNDDPTNLEAAASLRQKLEHTISIQEKVARCMHCGRAPFDAGADDPRP